jgi:hypothetical protein
LAEAGDDHFGDCLKHHAVLIDLVAVDIDLAEASVAIHERNYYFRTCGQGAGKEARIGTYIVDRDSFLLGGSGAADTPIEFDPGVFGGGPNVWTYLKVIGAHHVKPGPVVTIGETIDEFHRRLKQRGFRTDRRNSRLTVSTSRSRSGSITGDP